MTLNVVFGIILKIKKGRHMFNIYLFRTYALLTIINVITIEIRDNKRENLFHSITHSMSLTDMHLIHQFCVYV